MVLIPRFPEPADAGGDECGLADVGLFGDVGQVGQDLRGLTLRES